MNYLITDSPQTEPTIDFQHPYQHYCYLMTKKYFPFHKKIHQKIIKLIIINNYLINQNRDHKIYHKISEYKLAGEMKVVKTGNTLPGFLYKIIL